MLMKTLAAIGGAAMMAMAIVSPASAQDSGGGSGYGAANPDTTSTPSSRGEASRQPRRQERQQAPTPPTPEENMAAAQAIAATAGVACQVTSANLLGVTADQSKSYEATCAAGPGYILISSTPPFAADCVLLAGQAEQDRARDPAANVGTQCLIPENTDVLRVISVYATEAGVPCAVDQGASIGRSNDGNLIYEIGCNGADGYWIEKAGATWTKTECAVIATQSRCGCAANMPSSNPNRANAMGRDADGKAAMPP